ncbi:hypothetical protein KMT30_36615 [Streptomyces sp. IBSBF 2953]|uniref:DUF7144 family membrane protein n=1 Tax=Streptomyces TaxID=1883 RepID=UPI002119C0BE|nr:hypothetical protein [Streptomyces scabiei]MCQ9184470.1 hypothetical protein [Streptomyces hayashii]MDX3118148.1 hypothetical protein [Streptomyces scabiei]
MSDQPHAQPSHGSPVWDPSHQGTGTPPAGPPDGPGGAGVAAGGVVFAGVLMFVTGVLAAFQGIAAIARDDVYARLGSYVYEMNLTGWGWVLLVVGVVAAATGWGLLTGAVWARVSGIALASLSLVLQFLFLPYAPFWAVVQIALDVFVIWALATYDPAASPRQG